jgi:hypothetical protein
MSSTFNNILFSRGDSGESLLPPKMVRPDFLYAVANQNGFPVSRHWCGVNPSNDNLNVEFMLLVSAFNLEMALSGNTNAAIPCFILE